MNRKDMFKKLMVFTFVFVLVFASTVASGQQLSIGLPEESEGAAVMDTVEAETVVDEEISAAAESALTMEPLSAGFASKPKKAIYILPGFLGSRLYSQKNSGLEIWFCLGFAPEIASSLLGGQPEFVNNPSGTGMLAYADRNRDHTGVLATYLPLIASIRTCLALNGLRNTYDVEFFSYNFVADINDTARELADDINAKGYEKVILIGHSNGGLLMSTFIAQSEENKNKVEKAIGIAAPLWGSYTGLEPLETGSMTMFDGSFHSAFISLGHDIFLKPISKSWVKAWSQNSPNVYQVLPGNEYISRIPIIYRTDSGTQVINNMTDYYNLLNASSNVNATLLNGSNRSLKYLRETVFENDVAKQYEGVDLTMIGCEYGFVTPYSAVYRQSGANAIYDGAIYNKAGDGIVTGLSMKAGGHINFINLRYVDHYLNHFDPRVMHIINEIILDRSVSGAISESGDVPAASQTSSASPSVGMSDMIRVEIKSSDPLSATLSNSGIRVNINNSRGRTVARTLGETQLGFAGNNFVFSSWNTKDYATNIICYIPKSGYTMEVFTGNVNRSASDLKVFTSTLDPSGAILSRHEYRLTGANLLSGSVFTLDGSKSMKPVNSRNANLTELSSEIYKQDWTFSTAALILQQGAAATPEIIGPDASQMIMSNYDWASSDPYVAQVSSSGVITARGPGIAVITATARDDSYKMGYIEVRVTDY